GPGDSCPGSTWRTACRATSKTVRTRREPAKVNMARRIWTAGHSTLPAEALVALLQSCGVEAVADVRRFPASRRHPQFNRATMEGYHAQAGLRYLHLPGLGG